MAVFDVEMSVVGAVAVHSQYDCWSIVKAVDASGRHGEKNQSISDQSLVQRRAWCVLVFDYLLLPSPYVRSLPPNCHPPCFRPGPPLPPIAPASTARVSQKAYLLPLCCSTDGSHRYRLLGRCLMPMCLQQSLAHYTCNQTVFSYIESIAACRRHSNNGLTSTNAINGMCLSLIIFILDFDLYVEH